MWAAGVVPMLGGNTGVQMGDGLTRKSATMDDLRRAENAYPWLGGGSGNGQEERPYSCQVVKSLPPCKRAPSM